MRFTIGLKLNDEAQHLTAEGEDALVAALRVKAKHPDAKITYVRPMNRRGDARHPAFPLSADLR